MSRLCLTCLCSEVLRRRDVSKQMHVILRVCLFVQMKLHSLIRSSHNLPRNRHCDLNLLLSLFVLLFFFYFQG